MEALESVGIVLDNKQIQSIKGDHGQINSPSRLIAVMPRQYMPLHCTTVRVTPGVWWSQSIRTQHICAVTLQKKMKCKYGIASRAMYPKPPTISKSFNRQISWDQHDAEDCLWAFFNQVRYCNFFQKVVFLQ